MGRGMKIWNITGVRKPGKPLSLYGVTIQPGQSREVDPSWVLRYPQVLHVAIQSGDAHHGPALPSWYYHKQEEPMYKLTNTGDSPIVLEADGFSATQVAPGESITAEDDVAESFIKASKSKHLEAKKLSEDKKPASKKEASVEAAAPKEEPNPAPKSKPKTKAKVSKKKTASKK